MARKAVAEHAERLGMVGSNIGDLRTVVSEAFTNAVLYAYDEGVDGTIEIVVESEDDVLCLIVRDFGIGIFPRPDRDFPSLNMGLPIIGALSQEFQLSTKRGKGTELKICMPLRTRSGSQGG
jgi:anti-sigma regulatory factor (Ser/Thr protein kinase)